ncbi:type I-G CRISPR-associated protein Cas8g1/Csx17 [Thioalkalivibrio thiocyanodenitrificans]|uniref:type I-G CRISPR-associated protein Cas8g1/Csx17 n=1 Tax=Thioalkalivibrio thiocyanodenitrificans TaxID=243063 RepID=UPI000368B42D|nr:type I-U CRISPR-associated protein Csx17 [Thioalkalivibrio thiocyanodenitrificans]
MSDNERPIDWSKTTFDGARREQLRQAKRINVRQRLEALDQLTVLSERLQTMPRQAAVHGAAAGVHEPRADYRTDTSPHDIVLDGCTPTPLANYLKALGVLRLLSARDPQARGFWRGDRLVIRTALDRTAIERFFLHEYAPTPIISPWSGRAGFLEGDDGQDSKRKGAIILGRIENAVGKRFELYQQIFSAIRNVSMIQQLDQARTDRKRLEALKKANKLDQAGTDHLSAIKRQEADFKNALLRALRNELDDAVLPWIDACFALAGDERTPGPLLGSGGNEGSMDFSINHVGYLLELIDENTDEPTSLATRLLGNSLFADTVPRKSSSNIGFLDTFATGGANMSVGFEGGSSGNIWDSVLAIEGAILFASLTTKRLESTASGRPSFPFAVAPSFAGSGSLASRESARPELWLPLWNGAATIAEVVTLLAEGRVTKGRRQAHSGIDMLQAVSSLGTERGISAFNRFGFYERRGQGYYVATHLGRFEVPKVAHDNWVMTDLNRYGWLDAFRNFAQGDNTANRFLMLRKRLEDRLFALSGREPDKAGAQSLLVLLGRIQFALSSRSKAHEAVLPIPRLSEQWVTAADDGTPSFRIAKALAGLRGVGEEPLPLRAQIFPVQRRYNQWMNSEVKEKVRIYTGQKGRLIDTLCSLLERRLWLAEKLEMQDKPLDSAAGVTLEDVSTFLRDDAMDERIAALLPGLSLCEIPQDLERGAGAGAVPAAFALLKLSLTPDRILRSLGLLPDNMRLNVPAGMLAQLAAGNHGNRAVQTAWRRLRTSGIPPLVGLDALPSEDSILPLRASAALLIPLRYGAIGALADSVLNKRVRETETA